MYICGPTVYDSPHIGHARTYISFDVIRRILSEYFKYDVILVMNITDIDDKIIVRAKENGISCNELTKRYEDEFFNAMDKLKVLRPDFVTRVTEYVKETVEFVENIESKGLAYENNGSVYFDLAKYQERHKYNLLRPAVKTVEEETESGKRSREDFVLWKASKEGEPQYNTKWGAGRPGWHIECSAMSSSIFGSKLDIHAGGIDLAFPHHENEIAQCQGVFGMKWVNYFLHTGHLNISGRKMSKSLKNFLTIDDLLEDNSGMTLRMLFLQHGWNKDMDYEPEQLKEAESKVKRITNFISVSESLIKRGDKQALTKLDKIIIDKIDEYKSNIDASFCANFNIPHVIDDLLQIITTVNQVINELHSDVLKMTAKFIFRIGGILGLIDSSKERVDDSGIINLLAKFRADVRKAAKSKCENKVFYELSDQIRDEIKQYGYVIDDKADGSLIRRITN